MDFHRVTEVFKWQTGTSSQVSYTQFSGKYWGARLLLFHSRNQYWLTSYHEPGMVRSVGDTSVNEADLSSWELSRIAASGLTINHLPELQSPICGPFALGPKTSVFSYCQESKEPHFSDWMTSRFPFICHILSTKNLQGTRSHLYSSLLWNFKKCSVFSIDCIMQTLK